MKTTVFHFTTALLFSFLSTSAFSQETKEPVKPALLVIDIQNTYLAMMSSQDREEVMGNINYYIDLFRGYGYPVIRVYHYSEKYGPAKGTEGFEFPASVKIQPGDPKVIKTYPDGFNKTDLDEVIRETGCNTLFLCGLSATGCVLATWLGAMNYDYQAFLLKDAILSPNAEYTNQIENIFDAVGGEVVQLILRNAAR